MAQPSRHFQSTAHSRPKPRSLLQVDDLRNNPAPPYKLHFNPRDNGYEGEFANFRVKNNRIYLKSSDGQPDRQARPHPGDVYHDRKANVDRESCLDTVSPRDKSSQSWRHELGRLIAAIMFEKDNNHDQYAWYLDDFPEHYAMYARQKEQIKAEGSPSYRTDYYLYGSPTTVVSAFRSSYEFARHAMWIMDGMPRDRVGHSCCLCIYCTRGPDGKSAARQKPVTKELRRLRIAILRPEPTADSEIGGDDIELADDI